MKGEEKPDYKSCVEFLQQQLFTRCFSPGVMAVAAPLVVGIVLGVEALGGLLAGALGTGVLMAILHVQRRWSMG